MEDYLMFGAEIGAILVAIYLVVFRKKSMKNTLALLVLVAIISFAAFLLLHIDKEELHSEGTSQNTEVTR